ncbi:hypothetical protein Tco_0332581, partial [Tanacetum coccineum]
HTVRETHDRTLPENCAYIIAEAEAIHIILSGIGDEIYSIVDACILLTWTKNHTTNSLSASEEDNDPEQAQRDKDMQKSITLISKYFTKIYKPTNNNLRTSSNSKNKNVDSNPSTGNDRQTGQFRN